VVQAPHACGDATPGAWLLHSLYWIKQRTCIGILNMHVHYTHLDPTALQMLEPAMVTCATLTYPGRSVQRVPPILR
jgi:hypothetical protein